MLPSLAKLFSLYWSISYSPSPSPKKKSKSKNNVLSLTDDIFLLQYAIMFYFDPITSTLPSLSDTTKIQILRHNGFRTDSLGCDVVFVVVVIIIIIGLTALCGPWPSSEASAS
jgi:hypothetical protein